MAKYKVLVGLDYPPAKRAEPDEVVSDLPAKSIKWLREAGLIEPLDGAADPVADQPAEAVEGD